MIIIKVQGGLGNQMFQYALYKKYLSMNKEVYLDISAYETYKKHNGFELESVFNITPNRAGPQQIKLLANESKTFVQKVMQKLRKKSSHYIEEGFQYIPSILQRDDLYLEGYWQTEKYFKDIKTSINKDFFYDMSTDPINKKLLQEISQTNAVSIHIRRGDYINDTDAREIYGNIATLKYYQEAVNMINLKTNNPRFYIFSDDINWVKKNLTINNSTFIDWNTGESSFKDMILMNTCKHNIIANSSFSWWGAWLNQNTNKIVICPNKWLNTTETPDIYCDEWIKI